MTTRSTATIAASLRTGCNILRSATACVVNGQRRLSVNLPDRSLSALGLAGMVCKARDALSLQQFHLLTPAGEAARLEAIEARRVEAMARRAA